MRFPRALPMGAALALLLLTSVLLVSPAARAGADGSPVKIPTSRKVELEGDLHVPAKCNGVGVLLAPGQGYHKDLRLVTRSAEALTEAGFVVVRFNWAYFTAKAPVSEGYATELQDLDAALAYLRAQDGVTKVVLAGKSLGSLVSIARTAQKHDDLAGLALLTLPIHSSEDQAQRWFEASELDKVKLPTLIVSGDADPICDLKLLYELAAERAVPPRVVIVPGDHSLRPADKDKARAAENVDLAVRALVLWAQRWTTDESK